MTDAPLNHLETVMRDGATGHASVADFHAVVLESTLFVPSATEVQHHVGVFNLLIVPTPRSEIGMILAYTDKSRIEPEAAAQAPYIFEVQGMRLVRTLAPELGILINGGPDAAAELDPATLADMRRSIYR